MPAMPASPIPQTDPALIARVLRIIEPIWDLYFRAEVRNIERLPEEQTLVVGNHDGGLMPADGVAFAIAWYRQRRSPPPLRVLMHEIPFHITDQLRRFLHGIGCVSASPKSFESVLAAGESVLVYPGASREAFRRFRDRRQVTFAGRKGFIVRALRHHLPVTPIASAGAQETLFVLLEGKRLADWVGLKRLRADVWPLVAGVPWGLWFGPLWPYIPLPAKVVVDVLPPIHLENVLGRALRHEDAHDAEVIDRCFAAVLETVQAGVARLYNERRWPILG